MRVWPHSSQVSLDGRFPIVSEQHYFGPTTLQAIASAALRLRMLASVATAVAAVEASLRISPSGAHAAGVGASALSPLLSATASVTPEGPELLPGLRRQSTNASGGLARTSGAPLWGGGSGVIPSSANSFCTEPPGGRQLMALMSRSSSAVRDMPAACGVCYDEAEIVQAVPCRHRLCSTCAEELSRRLSRKPVACPFCRAPIRNFGPLAGKVQPGVALSRANGSRGALTRTSMPSQGDMARRSQTIPMLEE